MAARKLDMNHGFMKSIIRNQVDRDKYEKDEKSDRKMQNGSRQSSALRSKKPDLQIYRPPSTRSDISLMPEFQDAVFKLEFLDQVGDIYSLVVFKGDDPNEVAIKMGRMASLPKHLVRALSVRLQDEFREQLT